MQRNKSNSPRLMSIRAAARYLGISIATLRRMDRDEVLVPFRTPGGHRRYSRQMLDEYLENSRRRTPEERGHP